MDQICLLDIKVKADGDWHQLALDCPIAVDHEGAVVDLGPRLSQALGGGDRRSPRTAWPASGPPTGRRAPWRSQPSMPG